MEAATVRLEARVERLEERDESTRRRLGEQEVELRDAIAKQAEALMAIRDDVREIRTGKRFMLKLAGFAFAVFVATCAGVVVSAQWVMERALKDWQTQHNPAAHRRIEP